MKLYIPILAPRFLKAISFVIEVGNHAVWPFIISRQPMGPFTENHERIHLHQQFELSVIFSWLSIPLFFFDWTWMYGIAMVVWSWTPYAGPFYAMYAAHFFWNKWVRGMTGTKAYYEIVFEKEAYTYDQYLDYLERRPICGWIV
jgi:hypothetical protein